MIGSGISALRRAAKQALAGGIYYSGLLGAWQRMRRSLGEPRVHILGFHRVVPNFTLAARRAIPALCVSHATFEAQLAYLAAKMDVLDLGAALDVLAGRRHARRDACVLTFDDGYRDVYTQAFPILRRLGLPATVFVPTGYVGSGQELPHDRLYAALRWAARRPAAPALPHAEHWAELARARGAARAVEQACRFLPSRRLLEIAALLEDDYGTGEPPDPDGLPLDWEMCEEMIAGGLEIGSHSVWHTALGFESPESIRRELAESKADLELRLSRPARFLAYPNGVYSAEVIRAASELGYLAAVTTEDRTNRRGADPMRLGRKLLWQEHGRGLGRRPSPAVVASHLENIYGEFGLSRPIYGEVQPASFSPSPPEEVSCRA